MFTGPGWVATAILVTVLAAFASGRVRPEVIGLGTVLALGLSRILSPEAALGGFSDPTVVTIAALFVVSASLERTGVAAWVARALPRAVGANEPAMVAALMLICAGLAGFIHVVAATAVLLPIALAVCREIRVSPSRLLMPLAIASRLGGALTLIGKPSNLIVSSLLVQAGYAPLAFFSFLPVGAALLAVGVVFTLVAGRRLLPVRVPVGFNLAAVLPRELRETYRLRERLLRIRIDTRSPLARQSMAASALGASYGINVLSLTRGRKCYSAPGAEQQLLPGDELLVEAREDDVDRLRGLGPVEVTPESGGEQEPLETADIGLAEFVVAPRSHFAGKTLRDVKFRQRYGLNVVAMWHEGAPRRTWLAGLRLQVGDALVVQGPREHIRLLRSDLNFIPLDAPRAVRTSRALVSVFAVLALIALGASGLVPVSLTALLAAGIVVAGGCLTVRESLDAVEWPMLLVIGGLLPLGRALYETGAAQVLASAILRPGPQSPLLILTAVLVASVVVGHFVPSVPSTILMAPIGLSAAVALGVSPVPFMIAVASATSATLATPVSHPVSLMVMGPGGYRFSDYVRVGGPLALLLTVVLLLVVQIVWPL